VKVAPAHASEVFLNAVKRLGRAVLATVLVALLSAGCGNMPTGAPTRSLVPAEAACC